MVDIESMEWNEICDIVDRLEEIGDEHILCDCVRMICANIQEARDLVINQYGDVLYDDD